MRKLKMVTLALLLVSMLSGCCLFHDWVEADCVKAKHCTKCGEQEGKKLGHDWEAATCEQPETCDRCDKTRGEALGHTNTAWELSGEEMVSTCTVCNKDIRRPIDREMIGRQMILGRWEVSAMMDYDDGNWEFFDEPIFWVEFYEDGTGLLYIFEEMTGTLVFDLYDADNDEYEFTLEIDADSSYDFDYLVEGDTLFTFGSGLALAWERG